MYICVPEATDSHFFIWTYLPVIKDTTVDGFAARRKHQCLQALEARQDWQTRATLEIHGRSSGCLCSYPLKFNAEKTGEATTPVVWDLVCFAKQSCLSLDSPCPVLLYSTALQPYSSYSATCVSEVPTEVPLFFCILIELRLICQHSYGSFRGFHPRSHCGQESSR